MDITVQELKKKLDAKEDFIFLDVREPQEFAEFNLNARLIPLGSVMEAIPEFETQKDKEIVIHCRSGGRSGMAQQMFKAQGFSNVRNLEGGVLAWIDAFGPGKI